LLLVLLSACAGEVLDPDAVDPLAPPPGVLTPGAAAAGASAAQAAAGAGANSTSPSAAMSGTSPSLNLAGAPQYARFVRLTNAQWARSVQDILRLQAPSGLESVFQSPVSGTTDFTNNELVLGVDQRAASDFASAAEQLAVTATQTSDALQRVYSGTDADGFIATLGRRAYRRPLTAAENTAYRALYEAGAGPERTFAKGAERVLRAMLQSPHFLYRTELGEPGSQLTSYELAAKLSLWLRGTTPSDALLDAAAVPGMLDDVAGLAALATTMLEEPTALDLLRGFHHELYHFDRYATITKLGVRDFDPSLNAEYLESTQRFFDKLFTQGLGVRELLTATTGFVGPRMAAIYGVSAPTSGVVEHELGPQRIGYFMQLPFLSLYGLNGEPDSIHRGVTMNLDVLCAVLGPPIADLPPIPALQPGQTNRQRISTLTSGCGGVCHNEQINPIGFAFEHFDGMGRYRDTENGLSVDSTGAFKFSEGEVSFTGAADLLRGMASGSQAHRCYAKKLASFSLQRDIVADDVALLDTLTQVSMDEGSIKQVLLALVRHDAFRVRSRGVP
jgi:hypothetical protein